MESSERLYFQIDASNRLRGPGSLATGSRGSSLRRPTLDHLPGDG